MQVNLLHHPTAFASLQEAFDPVANAPLCRPFPRPIKAETGSWEKATAWYHSATPELGEPYQRKVTAGLAGGKCVAVLERCGGSCLARWAATLRPAQPGRGFMLTNRVSPRASDDCRAGGRGLRPYRAGRSRWPRVPRGGAPAVAFVDASAAMQEAAPRGGTINTRPPSAALRPASVSGPAANLSSACTRSSAALRPTWSDRKLHLRIVPQRKAAGPLEDRDPVGLRLRFRMCVPPVSGRIIRTLRKGESLAELFLRGDQARRRNSAAVDEPRERAGGK